VDNIFDITKEDLELVFPECKEKFNELSEFQIKEYKKMYLCTQKINIKHRLSKELKLSPSLYIIFKRCQDQKYSKETTYSFMVRHLMQENESLHKKIEFLLDNNKPFVPAKAESFNQMTLTIGGNSDQIR